MCDDVLCLPNHQAKGNSHGDSPSPLCAAPPTPEDSDAMIKRVEAVEGEIEKLRQQVGEGL